MSRTTTIRVDPTSIFYFCVVALGVMAACVAVGFRLGQEVPEPLSETFANYAQSGAEHSETLVAPARVVPDDTYTFYNTTPEPRQRRRAAAEPAPEASERAVAAPAERAVAEPTAQRTRVLEREPAPAARPEAARAPERSEPSVVAAAPAPATRTLTREPVAPAAEPAAEDSAPAADRAVAEGPAAIERVAVIAPQDSF